MLLDVRYTPRTQCARPGRPQCMRARGEHAHCLPQACSGRGREVAITGTPHPEHPRPLACVRSRRGTPALHLTHPKAPPPAGDLAVVAMIAPEATRDDHYGQHATTWPVAASARP